MSGSDPDARVYLLVDDQQLNRKMLSHVLKTATGCAVAEAENGIVAQEQLRSLGDQAVGVLCDFHMPECDGLQLLKAIRMGQVGAARALPFALMTSANEKDAIAAAIALDADAFLAKPVRKASLEENLGRLLPAAPLPIGDADRYAPVDVDNAVESLPVAAGSVETAGLSEVALVDLQEGAVLGAPVIGESGRVLAPADLVLTSRAIGLLSDLGVMDPSVTSVWVR